MPRRALISSFAVLSIAWTVAPAQAEDDPRFVQAFVQGLREKGYHDLAIDYLARLRAAKDTPAELRLLLDFEEGRALIDAGLHASDPDRAKEQFDLARTKLEAFIKKNPDRAEYSEAVVALAHLLYERGRNAMIQADEAPAKPEKDVKVNEARAAYISAHDAYTKAFDLFDKQFKTFDKFIPEIDPKFARREKIHGALLNAQLQLAVVDYEVAQTYAPGTPDRNERLDKAMAAFEKTYKDHRTQMAGFTARMWQGKCFEERGELGAAKGIYDELMRHVDPRLLPLQKKVDYFRILVMAKRKDYALAADECTRWINEFPKDDRSYEALGVRLELAKNILAQLGDADLTEADKAKAVGRAAEALKQVVRVYSPFKTEALSLLKKVAPKTAARAEDIAKLSFDDAVGQAEQAISLQQYDQAIAILQIALKRADSARDLVKLNRARYTLAFCYYMSKRYYEAAVITEHLARRYPNGEWSAKSTEIAMASMIDGYNTYTRGDRSSDLRRLLDLAKYTSETWPDAEQGDAGKMTIGQISLGSGKYAEAVAAFESVRSASGKWADAQGYSGDAHWKLSLGLREKGKAKEADDEVTKAIGLLNSAIKTRKSGGATSADLGLITNACDLSGIYLETGKGKEALALLEPITKELTVPNNRPAGLNGAYGRAMAGLLRAHVANGQVDAALADMKTLENSGGETANRAQLYFELGRLLEREIENLNKRNDKVGLKRTQEAYLKFLDALVKSKSGQTFESLSWAGGQLLKLHAPGEAEAVLTQVLDTYGKDSEFTTKLGAFDRLMLVRLKLVKALYEGQKFPEAEGLIKEIIAQFPRLMEPQMEKGYLLSAKAKAKKGSWNDAFAYWQNLATRLRGANPKPIQYFEAWYNAAVALQAQGEPAKAKQTLNGVMRLSPAVGNAEMKAKYQEMIASIK